MPTDTLEFFIVPLDEFLAASAPEPVANLAGRPVTRVTQQASIPEGVTALTFSGRKAKGKTALQNRVHTVNRPKQVFYRRDGLVTVQGAAKRDTITVSDFSQPLAHTATGTMGVSL